MKPMKINWLNLQNLLEVNLHLFKERLLWLFVTTDVHARDIIDGLVKDNVSSVFDFAW
jgi:hypothetical protein